MQSNEETRLSWNECMLGLVSANRCVAGAMSAATSCSAMK